MPGHTERDFETAIEAGLTSSGGYQRRHSSDDDETLALSPDDVIGFLKDSQSAKWAALEALLGPKTGATALDSLAKELELKGSLHVLRHGFKCCGKTFRMAYFRPNTRMNPEAAEQCARNRLTITRQVGFTSVMEKPGGGHKRCIIDVTLAVNGIPVVTAELKNPLTGQRAADAIRQFDHERDERDLLFAFKKRALVHFALDPDEVWMTTRLGGKETRFLPFNRGHNHGAGNPPVEGNWKTQYLWDEVLQADSLLEILQRFMHLEVKEKPIKTDKGVRTVRRETLTFRATTSSMRCAGQKFPFISQALPTPEKKGGGVMIDTAGKRFAVIVDEAHSSQSGETATASRGMRNKQGIEAAIAAQLSGEEDDDLSEETRAAVLRDALQRARQPNLSFFAFTATPKFKTKALFDEPGPSGASPFHAYSMRQAIEEGFILDVLQNYTTYKRFFGLIKQTEDDPDVPRKKAAKALTRYLELHPVNIEQVVSVIVEHFRLHVMHELGGRAKAMVVTGSRLAAVKYKLAFDRYIKAQGYSGIRSLVAFSGTIEDPDDPGSSYTEVAMNGGLSESELPETFERDDYRVLLVAEKYQTGFDQPLLQTMYVVKRLAGVQAVQTLSRLNRIAPGKSRTFVLDFANDEDDIHQAFKPYYETTPVGENADPHRLSELQHRLLEWAIFAPADVTAFAEVWYRGKRDHSASDHKVMNAVLDAVAQRFQERGEEEREEFRGQLTAYRNLYAFLSQIIPYQDSDLERLYAFVRNLLAKLPPPGHGQGFVLDDEVALRCFRLQQMTEGSIDLSQGDAYPLKGPTDIGTGGVKDDAVALSSLIDRLNERFGTDFTEADQLFFDQIRASAEHDETIAEAARANNFTNFAAYLDRMLDELFIARMEGNEEIFSRVMTDTEFRSAAHEHLAREIFRRVRGESAAH